MHLFRSRRALAPLRSLAPLPGLVFALALAAGPLEAQQKQRLSSVEEALGISAILAGGAGPASVNWIDEGERFAFTTRNPATQREQIVRYDPQTLSQQLLFDTQELTLPGTGEPLDYEEFRWAATGRHLVFQTDFRPIYRHSGVADFYVYGLEDRALVLAADDARTAELSPDGTMLGYERDGDLFVYYLERGDERRLTTGGSDTIFNGVFDWVYEEEFSLTQAWRWAPDSRRIAFWQTDERGVPIVRLTDYEGQHPDWVEIAYPKVGDTNPRVSGVVDVEGGEPRWLDVGLEEEHYIPRIYWTAAPDTLAVMVLDRAQAHLRVFLFDVNTGARSLVLEERAERGWIDVYDFFARAPDFLFFPPDSRDFFWVSDRDGWQHIYRYDYEGQLLNQVTRGPWMVTRIEGIQPATQTLFYTSTEESPLERHLYAIGYDGRGKRKLTRERGTHRVDLAPGGEYFIDGWSNTDTPRQVELWRTDGTRVAVLEDNGRTRGWLERNAYSPVELFRFTTSDSVRLDGSMIKPPDFDPSRRYPVMLSIYGGPGSQDVLDGFGTNGWHQYLAQQGYLVVGVNNRGNGGYGRDFMEVVHRQLGRWEAHDFVETARHLAGLPYVDGERIAIQGTSYGGYMTIYTMLRHPGTFALGIANSPVTDWRLYDTIYTERYMGLLDDNEEGYRESSTLPLADRLRGHLLLVHSAMDENVHPQNTMQLLTALASARRDAELRFYPPGAHGAAFDRASYVGMTEVYTKVLCERLKRTCDAPVLNR